MVGQPLKVLHVITGLGLGGAESMLTGMLTEAPDEGVEAIVVSLLPGGPNAERLAEAGIAVSDLGMTRGWPSLGAVRRLARCMRESRADVVQSWMYHADLAATAALALLPRGRRPALVWGVRCSDMDLARYGWRLRAVVGLSARLSGRPAAVVANSETGRAVHRRLGYRPRRFEVIANGIDTARFRPNPAARARVRAELGLDAEVPVVALVARVDPMKDHDTFLAALGQLNGTVGLLIGKGTEALPDRPGLRRLGGRTDVARLLPAADLIVNSSAFGEGFSNAIAEGMAAGLPAVATDVGDARAIIGETGLVVPPREPGALAEALGTLLSEAPQARAARSAAARARIEDRFPLGRAAQAFTRLHRELV